MAPEQSRLDLQELLETLLGSSNVYFQPPNNVSMQYPCIVYRRDFVDSKFADNIPYRHSKRYQVTVIDKDPDSPIPSRIAALPLTSFDRFFTAENLNHDVYNVYF